MRVPEKGTCKDTWLQVKGMLAEVNFYTMEIRCAEQVIRMLIAPGLWSVHFAKGDGPFNLGTLREAIAIEDTYSAHPEVHPGFDNKEQA